MKPVEELWIGLAQVIPSSPKNALESQQLGAQVNVIALAPDEKHFVAVKAALSTQGLTFSSLDDVETYAERLVKYGADDGVAQLAIKAEKEQTLQFATFQTFPLEDDNSDFAQLD